MEQTLSQKIVRGNITNIIKFLLLFPTSFILTPLFIRYLGVNTYGIWILIGAFIAYISISELNIGQGSVKFIAEYYAKKDFKSINEVVNTSFVVYAIISPIVSILILLILNWLLRTFFHVTAELVNVIKFVFILSIGAFVINLIFSPFSSILWGLQRLDIRNILDTVLGWFWALGAIFVLISRGGLKGLAVFAIIVALVRNIITVGIVKSIFPQIKWNPFLYDFKMLKKILQFSLKLFVVRIATLANAQVDKVVLSYFLGLSYVTFYQIGARLADFVIDIPHLLITPIMPAASELDAERDRERLKTLYLRTNKYVITIALPITFGLLLFALPFINLWIGPGYEKSIIAAKFLSICWFVIILNATAANILFGTNNPKPVAYSALVNIILNVSLSILLVIKYGYIGAIYGTYIASITSACYTKVMFHRIIKFSFWEMIKKDLVKPLFAGLFACSVILLSNLIYKSAGTWGVLILQCTLFMTLYIAFLRIIRYFDDFDKKLFQPYFPQRIIALFIR